MAKSRGYPDRRGMGAQSDFISETFVPSREHEKAQISRAKILLNSGVPFAEVARMLSVDPGWLSIQISGGSTVD
jgi:hypothetical protein